jgi:hypothetical protein
MIREELSEEYGDLLFMSEVEFDEAIIGVAERIGMEAVVAYDTDKIIEILSRDMTEEEAVEYFDFNIIGAYVGERTPIYIKKAPIARGLTSIDQEGWQSMPPV